VSKDEKSVSTAVQPRLTNI